MSKVLVFGHKNPDNDAIMSAVMFAQLANAIDGANNEYVACRLGGLPGESAALLAEVGMPEPELLEKIEPSDEPQRLFSPTTTSFPRRWTASRTPRSWPLSTTTASPTSPRPSLSPS